MLSHLARVSVLALWLLVTTATVNAAPAASTAQLLPSGTQLVVAIDLEALRKGAHWKALSALAAKGKFFEGMTNKADFSKAAAKTRSIVVALLNVTDTKRFVVIVEGAGLHSQIHKAMMKKAEGAVSEKHRGISLLIHEDTALAQIAGSVVVAPLEVMKMVIDVSAGRASSLGESKAFRVLLADIDAKADVWLAMDGGATGLGLPNLDRVEALALSLSLRLGLGLQASSRLASEAAASKMLSEMEAARSKLSSDMGVAALGLGTVVKNARLLQQGERLNLSLVLDQKEFAALAPIWNLVMGQL